MDNKVIVMECKKAINFDLDTNNLKLHYPSHHWRRAYSDIEKYLLNNGFEHQQWSGYISKQPMRHSKVEYLTRKMSKAYPWLKFCVRHFDVTDVSDRFDLLGVIGVPQKDIEPKILQEINIKPSIKSQITSATKKRNEQADKGAQHRDIENVI